MKKNSEKLRQELGERLEENKSLKEYNSLGVGGVADLFYAASTIDELTRAVFLANECSIPYLVIGGGNDIVPSDAGYAGLVIKNASSNIYFGTSSSEVVADSGVGLSTLINLAASHDLGGLEFLVGRKGSVGGALYSNYSSDTFEIGDFVKSLTVLVEDGGELEIASYPGKWMEFAYQSSRIREKYRGGNHPVILTVVFQLAVRRKDEILKLVREGWRKNGGDTQTERLVARDYFRDPISNGYEARYCLQKIGAQRMRVGEAAVANVNANELVNKKNASAHDIRKLADVLREEVYKRFGLLLEERIEYIGQW